MSTPQDVQRCVFCRQKPVEPAWRPFCGERCKTRDLANWADSAYRISGEPNDDVSPDADSDMPSHPRSTF